MQYNEDKIFEKIINDILLDDYNNLICKEHGRYAHMFYYKNDPPSPLFVSVDCSNRDELIATYINKNNINKIYTCTLTDTQYMDKCISFDNLYSPDYEWLTKEVMYNLLNSIELINMNKKIYNNYEKKKIINAFNEYTKNIPIIKKLETEICYKKKIVNLTECNNKINSIMTHGNKLLNLIDDILLEKANNVQRDADIECMKANAETAAAEAAKAAAKDAKAAADAAEADASDAKAVDAKLAEANISKANADAKLEETSKAKENADAKVINASKILENANKNIADIQKQKEQKLCKILDEILQPKD